MDYPPTRHSRRLVQKTNGQMGRRGRAEDSAVENHKFSSIRNYEPFQTQSYGFHH